MRQTFSRTSINLKRRRRCAADDGADGVATTATCHWWCTSAWPTRQRPWPVTPRLRPWRNFGGCSACSRSRPHLIFNSVGLRAGRNNFNATHWTEGLGLASSEGESVTPRATEGRRNLAAAVCLAAEWSKKTIWIGVTVEKVSTVATTVTRAGRAAAYRNVVASSSAPSAATLVS